MEPLLVTSSGSGLLAFFEIGVQALKLVAVAGGALVGGITTRLTLHVVTRLLLEKALPRLVRWPLQAAGAAALGFGVWWAFGPGGGFGLGGGGWFGPGGSQEMPADNPSRLVHQEEPPDLPPPVEPETLHIVLLGGDRVRQERFYELEGENQPRTLAGIRDIIRARPPGSPPVKGIEVIIFPDSVARDHPAVRELEKWAKQNGLAVSLNFPRGSGD
jgi:hypothetical protein